MHKDYTTEEQNLIATHWFTCPKCTTTFNFSTPALRDGEEAEHYRECFSAEDSQAEADHYSVL